MKQDDDWHKAWQFVETTSANLFLTGKAGTGKTTFLRQLRERTSKRMIVVAPTGIAAINAGGVTIHSFFQLHFAPYVPDTTFTSTTHPFQRFSKEKRRILQSINLLVIDEISMVRADLLDAIDSVLRRHRDRHKPFGGVQLLLIGDLQQLPPVVKDAEWALLSRYYDTPYFFGSLALKSTTYFTIELKTVYRQDDSRFLDILNRIRENTIDTGLLSELNKRYLPGFTPLNNEGYIRLVTHNHQAQQINDRELRQLNGQEFAYQAQIDGVFPETAFPADVSLLLKEGAQIMFLKNDISPEKRYYNGMIGQVVRLAHRHIWVKPKDSENVFELQPEEWANCKYTLNEETQEITETVDGTFKQYPIRLAWAITIHKSQGLTFDRAIIDASHSFAHGQAYVALSRCRRLEGLVLEAPLTSEAVITDHVVTDFVNQTAEQTPTPQTLSTLQKAYFKSVVDELFDFQPLNSCYQALIRFMDEHLYQLFPSLLVAHKTQLLRVHKDLIEVSTRFAEQYTRLLQADEGIPHTSLQARISAATPYFFEQLKPLHDLLNQSRIALDNKTLQKQWAERLKNFEEVLTEKEQLMEWGQKNDFSPSAYQQQKSKIWLNREGETEPTTRRKKKAEETKETATTEQMAADIKHPELYRDLLEWRRQKATHEGLPAYTILKQKALIAIVNQCPTTPHALSTIPHLGAKGIAKHGFEILAVVRRYLKTIDSSY